MSLSTISDRSVEVLSSVLIRFRRIRGDFASHPENAIIYSWDQLQV